MFLSPAPHPDRSLNEIKDKKQHPDLAFQEYCRNTRYEHVG